MKYFFSKFLLLSFAILIVFIPIVNIRAAAMMLWKQSMDRADQYHPEDFEIALKLAKFLGPNSLEESETYYKWALDSRSDEKRTELYLKCIESIQRFKSLDSDFEIRALERLAVTYCWQGNMVKSEEVLEKETSLRQQSIKKQANPDIFAVKELVAKWNELAELNIELCRYAKARQLMKSAEELIQTEVTKFNDEDFWAGENRKLKFHNQQIMEDFGEYKTVAEQLKEELKHKLPNDLETSPIAWQKYRDALLNDTQDEIREDCNLLERLANVERKDGQLKFANALYRACLDANEPQVRDYAPYTMQRMVDLNVHLQRMKDADKWSQHFVRQTKKNDLYPEDYAHALEMMAEVKSLQGDKAAAENNYRAAIKVRDAHESKRPERLMDACKLASLYTLDGRYADALTLMQPDLELFKAELGPEHPLTVCALQQYADTLRKIGKPHEDSALHEEPNVLKKAPLLSGWSEFPEEKSFTELLHD